MTGQQCTSDIECPGCQSNVPQPQTNPQYTPNVPGNDDAGKLDYKPGYSTLTTDFGSKAAIYNDNKTWLTLVSVFIYNEKGNLINLLDPNIGYNTTSSPPNPNQSSNYENRNGPIKVIQPLNLQPTRTLSNAISSYNTLSNNFDTNARNKIKEKFGNFIIDNPNIYGEDMVVVNKKIPFKFIELQVYGKWKDKFPATMPYIYERKLKFSKKTLFICDLAGVENSFQCVGLNDPDDNEKLIRKLIKKNNRDSLPIMKKLIAIMDALIASQ
jgi:hypothetical protein